MGRSVQGLNAIVTGAGSGINYEFARLLLEGGANVLIADLALRPEAEDLVAKYHSKSASPRAVFQQTDVTDWIQLNRMFEVAERELGPIDIVCPGAGVFEPRWTNFWIPPGSAQSKDTVESGRYMQLDINLTHPIRTTQLAIDHFVKQPQDSRGQKFIIHVSSIAGQNPGFVTPLYVASKHAINGFVWSMARLEKELGIRVAAVAPGIILTPLWTQENPEKMTFVKGSDEWVLPVEVAQAMLSLIEGDTVNEANDGTPGDIEIDGGTILEVGKGRIRKVSMFNDIGPGHIPGTTASGSEPLIQEIISGLKQGSA